MIFSWTYDAIELEALGNELEMEDDPSEPSYLEEAAAEPKGAQETPAIEKAGSVPQGVSFQFLFLCFE